MIVTFCLLSDIFFGKSIICVSDRLIKCSVNNFSIMFFNNLKTFRFWIHPKNYFKFELLVLLFYQNFYLFDKKATLKCYPLLLNLNIQSNLLFFIILNLHIERTYGWRWVQNLRRILSILSLTTFQCYMQKTPCYWKYTSCHSTYQIPSFEFYTDPILTRIRNWVWLRLDRTLRFRKEQTCHI